MNQPNPAQAERNALRHTIANQQREIQGLKHLVAKASLAIDYIASVADLSPRVAAIYKQADALNPAQPIPDPPGQAPTETTQQAATPEAYDSPLVPGQTPGSVQHLPADATGTPMDPGTTLPTAPYTNLVDVTAPIEGTQTHVPLDQTRTEVDVRVGDPMNPQRAFPWTGNNGPDAMGAQAGLQTAASAQQNRTMASIRLARLRLQANLEHGEDMEVAGRIQVDASLSDQAIEQEISILSRTLAAASHTASQRPAGAVPRPAQQVGRTAPSLVGAPTGGIQTQAVAGSIEADVENFDLFM